METNFPIKVGLERKNSQFIFKMQNFTKKSLFFCLNNYRDSSHMSKFPGRLLFCSIKLKN